MDRYAGTTQVQDLTKEGVDRAILDLLKKVNEIFALGVTSDEALQAQITALRSILDDEFSEWLPYPAGAYTFPSGNFVTSQAGQMPIGAVTTTPTKGTTSFDSMRYRISRRGRVEIQLAYVQTGAGIAGVGSYLWPLPPGISFPAGTLLFSSTPPGQAIGVGVAEASGSGSRMAVAMAYSSNLFRVLTYNSSTSTVLNDINSADFPLSSATAKYTFSLSF